MEKPTLFLVVVSDRIRSQLKELTLTDLELAELCRSLFPHIHTLPVFMLKRRKRLPKKLLAADVNRAIFERLGQTNDTGLWWCGKVVDYNNNIHLTACPAHTTEPGALTEIIQRGGFTPCIVAVASSDKKAMQTAAADDGMPIVDTIYIKQENLPLPAPA